MKQRGRKLDLSFIYWVKEKKKRIGMRWTGKKASEGIEGLRIRQMKIRKA